MTPPKRPFGSCVSCKNPTFDHVLHSMVGACVFGLTYFVPRHLRMEDEVMPSDCARCPCYEARKEKP